MKQTSKHGCRFCSTRACSLFLFCLKTQTFPLTWKHALVQPIFKKGDRSNPSNYRPIALTSTVSKVHECLLNSHFLKHLESNSLPSDHQYGVHKAISTGDILSYITNVGASLRDDGESFVVGLDISKAFDRVWHRDLISKLPSFTFPPSLCSLTSSFLSDHSISVIVDGSSSPPSPSTAVHLRVPFCPQHSSFFLSMTFFLPQIAKCTRMLMTQHYIPPCLSHLPHLPSLDRHLVSSQPPL